MMPLDPEVEIQTLPQTAQRSDINQVSIYSSVHVGCSVRSTVNTSIINTPHIPFPVSLIETNLHLIHELIWSHMQCIRTNESMN